jgi:signal transduction histidine kinase/CheY-like chemotaxis protein
MEQNKNPPLMQNFIAFSIALFLAILIAGSMAFIFSMRQIIRTNKGNELSKMLEIGRIKLENSVNKEIAIALKMASSPLIQRYFMNPSDPELEKIAFEEIADYRKVFTGSVFWISDINKYFYFDDRKPYILDCAAPENYWYPMTLNETEGYNFNINYNPDLNVTNLWINVPVFDNERKAIGIAGTGVNLSEFINTIYKAYTGNAELYFFNAAGEITGSRDVELVAAKKKIEEELGDMGTEVFAIAKKLKPGETLTYNTPKGHIAVGTIPTLEWYSVASASIGINDFKTPMTRLFLVVLAVIVLIFIIFNIFIARLLNPLRQTMKSLEATSRYKSDFLAKMSHEIRTPMNAIAGMSELALRENLPPAASEHIKTIKQASANLLSIINDILDLSKIESGKLEIIPTDYLFPSLVNNVADIIKMRSMDSNLQFTANIDGSIPNMLFGDETRVRQILLNVLSNAVKYTKKGFISFSVKGKITEEDTVLLTIEVADSGIGIKQEDMAKLFGDFVQVDLAVNRGVEGTGLGLAITKNLVKAMGGDISVYSEYGKGSTFTIMLPQKISSAKTLAEIENQKETGKATARFNAPNARILVVDDISTNLQVAKGLLLPYKMQIDLCLSGAEAIQAIKVNRYDLLFMDHMMPEIDGVEAVKRIRELGDEEPYYRNLPIIALTANAISGVKEMFLASGFNDFLSKPIDTVKLNIILEKWIPKEKQEKPQEEIKADNESDFTVIEIDGVDVEKGISMMGGTVKNYLRALAVFHKDGIQKIGEIKKSLETDNYPLYTIYVHGLKSAAANIGANELSEAAKQLEMAGKQGDFEFIKLRNAQFLTSLQALLDSINVVIAANIEELSKSTDYEALRSGLVKLKEAIDATNRTAIDEAANGLRKFTQAFDVGFDVEVIVQDALIGEYEEAKSMIDKLL